MKAMKQWRPKRIVNYQIMAIQRNKSEQGEKHLFCLFCLHTAFHVLVLLFNAKENKGKHFTQDNFTAKKNYFCTKILF